MREVVLAPSEISKRHQKFVFVHILQIQHWRDGRAGGLRRRAWCRAMPQAAVFQYIFDHVGLIPFLNESNDLHCSAALWTQQGDQLPTRV